MSDFRKDLLNRFSTLYGESHKKLVSWFSDLLETSAETEWNNETLRILVLAHEASPYTGKGSY